MGGVSERRGKVARTPLRKALFQAAGFTSTMRPGSASRVNGARSSQNSRERTLPVARSVREKPQTTTSASSATAVS